MDRSLSAALLSALVFPGAGQLFLKRHLRAVAFIVPALAATGSFVRGIMARAMPMVDQILAGTLAPDPLQIAAELERQGDAAGGNMNLAAALMLVCWLASIVDAWLLGRRLSTPDLKG
jgi:hypothetical protein